MFEGTVRRQTHTRRHALKLGAAAVAVGSLQRPAQAAAAACRVPVFEVAIADAATATAAGWRTLPVMRAPRRFDMLGLRWSRGSQARAEVRARPRNGDWTPWTALHAMGDHGPDSGRAIAGTEPCWTDSADFFQIRVLGRPRGLRVRFVRAKPSARLARRSSRRVRARASQATAPRIITRAEWGGDSCPPRSPAEYGEVQVAFVHHTVNANDYGPEDSAAIVLGICRYHRDSNKWNDLGYNFLVDKYGQIFEGRAGGIDQAVIGAQAQGYNAVSTGIACLGDYSAIAQTPEGIDALARLIAWKLPLHGAPVTGQVVVTSAGGPANRYPEGTQVTLERISGHRDGDSTSCPGEGLYAQLPDLRNRTSGLAVPVSALSARASRTRVRHPSPVPMSGGLRFSDGASAAGKPIQIQHQASGAAWLLIAETQTGGDGTWSTSVTAPGSGLLRAVFPGDGAHPPLEAAPVTVEVLPRLTISLSARRLAPGRKVRVKGTIGPAPPTKLQLTFERRVGRRWVRVQRKRINVRGGGFDTVVRPKQPGLYRVTIEGPGAIIRRQLRAINVTGGASAS